ncbi:MAG: peroxidase family protein, partial [Verrucomicrobiales bacterium]
REVSNAVVDQEEDIKNRRGATDFLWQWGQFLDHDLTETPTIVPEEPFDIYIPEGDIWFDPEGTNSAVLSFDRSYYELEHGVREQVNDLTSFIDGSNVYGSDETRSYALRQLDGSGMLKTTTSDYGDLLPYNEGGFKNVPDESAFWFIAGDTRVNEQVGLTALHTLFVREHNYWAQQYREGNPSATGDEIFEYARQIVGAEMQHITYEEYLPVILGHHALPPYQGYAEDVDPRIANEFATAAYRFGHTLCSPSLLRLDENGDTAEEGDLELSAAFFDPTQIENYGIETLLRGLAGQECQELDHQVVDGLRNFLFGSPGAGGIDLPSLNMQRGRDHGLPSYTEVREALGFPPAEDFSDITPNEELQESLAAVYDDVEQVDLWIGGLCEPHVRGAMVGPVFHAILTDQFRRLRDGDRFWYRHALSDELLELVEEQSLAEIIRRNTDIGDEIQDQVFLSDEAQDEADHLHHPRPEDAPASR